MGKDINIKVKTEGVDQAAAQIGGVTESIQQMTAAQRESFEAAQLAEEKATGVTAALDGVGDASIQAGQDQRDFAAYLVQSSQDAQDFQNYLDGAKASAENFGDTSQQAGNAAGKGLERATEKATFFDRMMNNIVSSAFRMVAGFLGLQGVMKLFSALNEQLDQMLEKQTKLTEKSLIASEGGQSLEASTGTVGKQEYWARQILSLQKAGGMESPDMAVEMMLGMQEATKDVGGIQNPAVASMLERLAPKLGASNKSASDLAAIFEAAAKEGVAPSGMEAFISKGLGVSDAQTTAYMQSFVGKSRSSMAAEQYQSQISITGNRSWELRLARAKEELDRRDILGENNLAVKDRNEVLGIALDSLAQDLAMARDNATGAERDRLDQESRRMSYYASRTGLLRNQFDPAARKVFLQRGLAGEQTAQSVAPRDTEAGKVAPQSITINNDYSHNTYPMPVVGAEHLRRGARVDPNDI